jgi:DNA repair protein SbcD/Mre11
MKFIHCADVHLDTPLQGLAHYPGAPVNEIRNATRRAFEKIINVAIPQARCVVAEMNQCHQR